MDLVIAGGVESMSRAPFVMNKADAAFARGIALEDTTLGWRFVNPRMEQVYGTHSMSETAEHVAAEWRDLARRSGRLRRCEASSAPGRRSRLAGWPRKSRR